MQSDQNKSHKFCKLFVFQMAREDNRSAAGHRPSAIAERLRIRQEWSALKEIERNTLNESSNQINNSMKQTALTNFVIFNPTSASKSRKVSKKPTPRRQQRLSISEALLGLVVHVDVGSASKALALRAALTALGATVSPVWNNLVTHLVWSDGGSRQIRSKARALACKLVSPLWVEACATAGRRLPENVFPAASRPSDLPSPKTLKEMLQKVEQENIPLNLLVESQESESNKAPRLRISSDTDTNTSANKSKSTSKNNNDPDIQACINTAPRRVLPKSTSPEQPIKSKRRLFTQKEAETRSQIGDGTDEDLTPARPKTIQNRIMAQKKKQLNREIVLKFVGTTKTTTNNQKLKMTQGSDKEPRIVLTGMSRQERHEIIRAIKHLNGKVQSTVNKRTTHILLGTCGPYRADKIYYCNKCDSVEKVLSQMFETNLAVRNNNRKELTLCKCISVLNKKNNGQDNDLNTSLLDQGKDSQDMCSSVETVVINNKPRTLNALLGAVRGCRVLYSKWALDSLKVNRWVHHFGYEVKHMKKISDKARFERSALQKTHSEYTYNVFNGTKIQISPNAEQKDAVTQLLTVCGAKIQNGRQDGGSDITIGRESGKICSKWVFDSIVAGRLRTTRRYINSDVNQ